MLTPLRSTVFLSCLVRLEWDPGDTAERGHSWACIFLCSLEGSMEFNRCWMEWLAGVRRTALLNTCQAAPSPQTV